MSMEDDKGIKISPKYYQNDWRKLNLNSDIQKDWEQAIVIFKDRMEGRYIKQIEVLDKNGNREIGLYSGYAIMSLICLFIETIEQFCNGNIKNTQNYPSAKCLFFPHLLGKRKEKNQISNDAVTFWNFFQRSPELKKFFHNQEAANVFYKSFRCGLLHSGQTKGKSLIHIRKDEPILRWIDKNNINNGISIHRRLFFDEVLKVYNNFIEDLEKPHNLNFRKKTLMKKMNFIVEQK